MLQSLTSTIQPTLESLGSRVAPSWFDEAKFGIFIHWGVFAIPAFGEHFGDISAVFKHDYDRAVVRSPYSEWYQNAIRVPGTAAHTFHQETFNGAPYTDFKQPFVDGLKHWDPDAWAETFKKSGARYVVLVTKHHDGFCLWPSAVHNPHLDHWYTERDIVGELAAAVRRAGLKFGVYYSGGIDWSFNKKPVSTLGDFVGSVPGGNYGAYATAQVRELIERYEPSVLWNDIAWPTNLSSLLELFASYYNRVPDGVVNDRWLHATWYMKALRTKLGRRVFDALAKRALAKSAGNQKGVVPPPIPHSDFRTPEYTVFPDIQAKKWEATRGMSHSFGFNRNDKPDDYEPAHALLHGFIDAVSKNGNLLLNVGPRGVDGGIPVEQLDRLNCFGDWLSKNGHAIYGTRPWKISDARTGCGLDVRFTTSGGDLHVILLGTPSAEELVLKDVILAEKPGHMNDGAPVTVERRGNDSVLRLHSVLPDAAAHALTFALPDPDMD